MTDKKDLIIAVLATFSITVALFGVLPTRSSPAAEYDPFLDYNEDGVINMRDIGYMTTLFMATGNTTRNVTVTNFPSQTFGYGVLYVGRLNLTGAGLYWSTNPNCSGGYSRVAITVHIISYRVPSGYGATLKLSGINWALDDLITLGMTYEATSFQVSISPTYYTIPYAMNPVPTKGPFFSLVFQATTTAPNPQNVWVLFDVYAYLRNE